MSKLGFCFLVFIITSSVATAQTTGILSSQFNVTRGEANARPIRALAQAINVLTYGAVGDGVTDDTAAVQSAINAAAGSTAYFPGGYTFSVSNLSLPNGTTLEGDGFNSKIVARNGGSSAYLIASESFLAPARTSFDGEQAIVDMNLNGAGIKGSVVVLRAWDSHVTGNWIYGSNGATTIGSDSNVGADLLLTTKGMDGTEQTVGDICNGYIDHNRLGFPGGTTALYNLRTYDPDFHITDWFLESNWIEGENNTISNVLIMDGGGWLIRGNHMYAPKYSTSAICILNNASAFNAGCDLTLQEPNWDTLVADNDFEDSVGYQLSGEAGKFTVFGPGNMVGGPNDPHKAYFVAGFGNYVDDTTISLDNLYYGGQIIHDYSWPTKVLTSSGDVFSNPQPVITIGEGQVNMWSLVNNGLTMTGSTIGQPRRLLPLPLTDQKPAAYTGPFTSDGLSAGNANSNRLDSGTYLGNSPRSPAGPTPGKLTCWTAQGTIGSCSTQPDQTGSCVCN